MNYCFGLFLLPLVETFDVGSAAVSLVCLVLERFGQTTLGSWESWQRRLIKLIMLMLTQEGSWESSQRSLINNNTQVGSLCVGVLSLLAPGTAWLTDRFGARLVQNSTLHISNPNTAAAILPRGILFGEGLKKQTLLCLLANDHFRFSFSSLEVSTTISLPSGSVCICLVL